MEKGGDGRIEYSFRCYWAKKKENRFENKRKGNDEREERKIGSIVI